MTERILEAQIGRSSDGDFWVTKNYPQWIKVREIWLPTSVEAKHIAIKIKKTATNIRKRKDFSFFRNFVKNLNFKNILQLIRYTVFRRRTGLFNSVSDCCLGV